MNTLKSYYKACTTKKAYIVTEDISTNFMAMRYTATNDIDKYVNDETVSILASENYYELLDVLNMKMEELSLAWGKMCYYYDWDEFLKKYDMTDYQHANAIKLLEDI